MNTIKEKPIDFVITWVDGSDIEWLQEKKKYNLSIDVDASVSRYRDYGTLKYVLRSIDKFAPWVRNIFLVTNGQIPDWLSLENPKLKLVKHSDFMPTEYLPTFSSHPIEWNFHKIDGLSENFVYFNDDVILAAPVKPTDFFKRDLPCDTFGLGMIAAIEFTSHIAFNNMMVLNTHFDFKKTIRNHRHKFFCWKYGSELIKTRIMSTRSVFYGMHDQHIALALKKSYFTLLWEKEPVLINETCKNKFRSKNDVSFWLVRYWQLLTGNFIPRSNRFGKFYRMYDFVQDKNIKKKLKKGKNKAICVNDNNEDIMRFEEEKSRFQEIMNTILGEKCCFEK